MAEFHLYRGISIEGVEGTVLVRTGTPTLVTFPGQEEYIKYPSPLPMMADSDSVVNETGVWRVVDGKEAEICVVMDWTAQKDLPDWLVTHGGFKDERQGVLYTPEPLPDRFVLYSLAYIDDVGNVRPSPRANSSHGWPDRMTVEEFYMVE